MKSWLLLLPALAIALLLLPQFGEAKIGDVSRKNTLKSTVADELEGSADREDDEDYIDEDDDDYDDEGSGQYAYDDEEAELIPDEDDTPSSSSSSSRTTEFPPFGSSETELEELENAIIDDFHFDDSGKKSANDDGELYEYYSEEYEPDYDDDDEDDDAYDDEDEKSNKVLYRAESDIVVTAASDESDSGSFELSYLYIMLASAFVSFALALATFFLCRSRSLAERQRMRMKRGSTSAAMASMGQPFTVITPPTAAQFRQSSIVKSYQRVPTSTREFLEAPPPAYSATTATIDMAAAEQNREPLLPDGHEQQ